MDLGAHPRPRQGVHHHLGHPCIRAIGHQQDTVGEQDRLVHVVRDHERRLPGVAHQPQHLVLQRPARQCVECRERLVHQQQLRFDGERPGDADALLHAPGKFGRLAARRLAQAHQVQHLRRVLLHLGARPAAMAGPHGEGDVAQRGQPRQQRVGLEDHGAVQRRATDLAAVHHDRAAVRRLQPGQYIQDRGLAAAGMADQGHEFPPVQPEPHVAEHRARAVAALDPLHGQPMPHDARWPLRVAARPWSALSRRSETAMAILAMRWPWRVGLAPCRAPCPRARSAGSRPRCPRWRGCSTGSRRSSRCPCRPPTSRPR